MTSFVEIDSDIDLGFDVQELADVLLAAVLDFENCPYEAQVELSVTHSDEVHEMNKEFRGIDSTTDVLSFPSMEFDTPGDFTYADEHEADVFDPETGELMIGDIVINVDRVYSQAEEYGHSVKREFAFLMTHSLFHLCGYDHMEKAEADVMEERQKEVLNSLGITRD